MTNLFSLGLVFIALSGSAPAQQNPEKPAINPQTGNHRPDTVNYRAYRGQTRFSKRQKTQTKGTVQPMMRESVK